MATAPRPPQFAPVQPSNGASTASIELRHLRLVSAIGEHGSLTAAARHLDLTQPALSHQLRAIESRLKTPLFERTARRMVPTTAGAALLSLARDVLSQVSGYERQLIAGGLVDVSGNVRIATQCYTCYHWLPPVLRAFSKRWPHVDLQIAAECTAAPLVALREGLLDIAIVHTRLPDRRVRFEPGFEDELVVVVPTDHRLSQRPFVARQDLADEHLILYSTADDRLEVLYNILEPAGVTPRRITRIQLTEAIVELVCAGLGVTVLSRWAARAFAARRALKLVRLTRSGYTRQWYVATRADEPAPPHRAELVALLTRHMSGGPVVPGPAVVSRHEPL